MRRKKLKDKVELTGDITAPDGAVVASIGAKTLAVVGEPDGRHVVLGAGEEEISLPVVLEERERPLVALHQDRPHLASSTAMP